MLDLAEVSLFSLQSGRSASRPARCTGRRRTLFARLARWANQGNLPTKEWSVDPRLYGRRTFLHVSAKSALGSWLGAATLTTSCRESTPRAAGIEPSPPAPEPADCLAERGADTVVVSTMAALELAVAAAPPGRHILVAPGTYEIATIALNGNGASGNPIVIRPQNGLGTVTINDPRWTLSENSSWLVVEQFYFTGSRIVLQGDHNRISRCRFRNINVSASIVTEAARDCRINHCDFADLNPSPGGRPQPIDIKAGHFVYGTAARLLIDYCYFHDMTPAFGQNGMEIARTYATRPALELARGETVTVDHCLFENIDIPDEGEIITVKMGGWITRFCTFYGVVMYYSFRTARDSELRSCWFEQMTGTCLNVFGPDHLVIGNRFVGGLSIRVAAGDGAWADMVSGAAPIETYAPATNCRLIGNAFGTGRMNVGGYWGNQRQTLPAHGNLIEATSPASAVNLIPAWQVGTIVNPTTAEAFTSAVKLTARDVGLSAPDPVCA
jgi:hypothetical protein